MKKMIAATALTTQLCACGTQQLPMTSTWHVADVYTTPGTPSQPTAPTYLVLGNSSVSGSTGCAQFQGKVKFTPSAEKPEKVELSEMKYDSTDCVGPERFYHDSLVQLLAGELDVRRTNDEMLLLGPGELDRPGVRLVATK